MNARRAAAVLTACGLATFTLRTSSAGAAEPEVGLVRLVQASPAIAPGTRLSVGGTDVLAPPFGESAEIAVPAASQLDVRVSGRIVALTGASDLQAGRVRTMALFPVVGAEGTLTSNSAAVGLSDAPPVAGPEQASVRLVNLAPDTGELALDV